MILPSEGAVSWSGDSVPETWCVNKGIHWKQATNQSQGIMATHVHQGKMVLENPEEATQTYGHSGSNQLPWIRCSISTPPCRLRPNVFQPNPQGSPRQATFFGLIQISTHLNRIFSLHDCLVLAKMWTIWRLPDG